MNPEITIKIPMSGQAVTSTGVATEVAAGPAPDSTDYSAIEASGVAAPGPEETVSFSISSDVGTDAPPPQEAVKEAQASTGLAPGPLDNDASDTAAASSNTSAPAPGFDEVQSEDAAPAPE